MNPSLTTQSALSAREKLARIRIVLSHPSHPGNIGAAARAMKNMGITQLVLVNPKRFPDDEAIARAAGAEDILVHCRQYQSLDAALAGATLTLAVSARQRNLGPESLPAREAAPLALDQTATGDVALVFGNETTGLSNAEVQRCQRCVFIPANPDYSSLNLGAAVQVLCYELRLAAFNGSPAFPSKTVPFSSPSASHDDIERFYAHLEAVMVLTGFLDPQNPKRLLPKLRRLFGRAALEQDEINILRGLLDAVEKNTAR